MVNMRIISEPINWVKVPLMAVTFLIGFHLLQQFVMEKLANQEEQDV